MSAVWMVCNNCGCVDSGPDGAMYECPSCGWADGWGAEDHADAERQAMPIRARGRFDAAGVAPSGGDAPGGSDGA